MKIFFTLGLLFFSFSYAKESPDKFIFSLKKLGNDQLIGDYSSNKVIHVGFFDNREACELDYSGAVWNSEDQTCILEYNDTLNIFSASTEDFYEVKMNVTGNGLSFCEFSGHLIRRGNTLVFPDSQIKEKFKIILSENSASILDQGYADANCGLNAYIDGRTFKK